MPFFPSIQCFFLTMAPFFPKRLIEFLNKYLVIISASEIIHLVVLHAIQLSYRYCSLDEMIVDHTVKTAGHWLNQANCSYRRYKYKCTWLTYYRKDFISSFCSFHRIKRKTVQLFGWFLHHGHTAVIEMYLTRFFTFSFPGENGRNQSTGRLTRNSKPHGRVRINLNGSLCCTESVHT